MTDGVRLAASLYRPAGSEPVPALLEALPYRKDDATLADAEWYRRLRDEGRFAVCRLDLRGTGSSQGVAVDEYPPSEVEDLATVIAWCAAQPWCSGRVGMFGTSYSGFNALHAAMAGPPQLGAVCALFASDDRYSDDVHYGGGALRALDLLDYPLYMVALNALPPVPTRAGADWRRAWSERIDTLEPWLLRWLAEPHDGPYWRQGSIRPRTGRIRCPTMLIAGWADGYRNATFRVFEQLRGPRRLLIGPWAHMSPERARPGPRVDVIPELIRWFDRHLRGRDNGIDREPPIAVFVPEPTHPAADRDEVRGRFRLEPTWPPERMAASTLRSEAAIGPAPVADGRRTLPLRGPVGVTGSIWCAGALPFGQPWDQRDDEVFGLVWDWPVTVGPLEVIGTPRLRLRLASSAPVATLSARLTDVFPDGTTQLVSRGVQNLTCVSGTCSPSPLRPGAHRDFAVELDATAFVFPPGHRVRLTLSAGDWPSVWPPPRPVSLDVELASLRLDLPVLLGPGPTAVAPRLRMVGGAPPAGGPAVVWRVEDDRLRRERRVVIDHGSRTRLPGGGWLRERCAGAVGASWRDPGLAWARGTAWYAMGVAEATVGTRADLQVRSDHDRLDVHLRLRARERGGMSRERRWVRRYPRRLQ